MGKKMQITVNGEKKVFANGISVQDLLDEFKITSTLVAVEVNLEIVPKSDYADYTLRDEDKIEIVHFVGGG